MAGQDPCAFPDPLRAPMFVLHTPAVDFIENRMPGYHPAFDTRRLHYNPVQSQFVPSAGLAAAMHHVPGLLAVSPPPAGPAPLPPRSAPSCINDMAFWTGVFPEAMERLSQEPLPYRGAYRPQWGIRHMGAWADVQAKLDMAQRAYEFDHGHQRTAVFRRKMRLAADKVSTPLQQGVKLVPDTDMTSPVVGVIGLLLDAYRQAAKVRETVNSGFDDLPEAFVRMDFYLQSYPKDQNIHMACVDLVVAVFKAIEEAIEFYTSAQAKRAGRAILTGEQYQQKLCRSLKDINVASERLESQVRMSLNHRVISDGDEARKAFAAINQDNWTTQQALGAIMNDTRVGWQAIAFCCNLLNKTNRLLSDLERNWPPVFSLSRPITPAGLPAMPRPSLWTPRELWSHLCIPNLDEMDLERALCSAGDIILEDRGRAEQVLSTPDFGRWISSPGAAKLLVHGEFDSTGAADRPVSPFSVLCATMVKSLRLRAAVSLVFFCGCHLAYDEHRGSRAMIRSLLAQLLRQFPATHVEADPRVGVPELGRASEAQLCGLFARLVRQLPPGTPVFCLIDGINAYESELFLDGMDTVVLALLGLVDESLAAGRVNFKLLLTSPQPTVEVRKAFDQEPGTLLYTAQLPVPEGSVGLERFQEFLPL